MLKGFLCVSVAAVLTLRMGAQARRASELRIELMEPGGSVNPNYSASLEHIQDHLPIASADMAPDGVLRFPEIPYGEYRLTIANGHGDSVDEHLITVNSQTSTIVLRLPAETASSPASAGNVVTVSELRHPIQKKALSSFMASLKLVARGDYEQAVHELQKAINTSPDYAAAYSTLAAIHIRMGLYGHAVDEITRAINIAGPNARDLSNMAIADYNLERYADSQEVARWALRLDSNCDLAHYILGASLAKDRRTMSESVVHLERAARTIPTAKTMLLIVQKALSHD
jgi:tetratricopeptide (TPR) repeat protein